MKTLIIIFCVLLSYSSFAQKAEITVLDPDMETKDLEKNFNVHRGGTHKSSLPDRDLREEVLAGVESVSKFDELGKDILFMDLKSKSLDELKKKYKDIPSKDLKIMKERI